MEIKALTKGVLRELEAHGYAEHTLRQRECYFKMIERWFNDMHVGELTSATATEYLSTLSVRLQSGAIGKSYFNKLTCSVRRLCEYAETGGVELGSIPRDNIFLPSAESVILIEKALSTTNLTDKYKDKLHSVLRRFFCFTEDQGVCERDITMDIMVSFIHHCRDVSSGYMAYIVHSLRVLSEYLVSTGAMTREPDFRFIVPKRSQRKIIPAFTEQEVSAVLAKIDRTTPTGKRDYAVILLAIGTGLRAGDIVTLKRTEIDWKSRTISITQGKTEKPLIIPISGQICNAISDYILNGRPQSDCENVFLRVSTPFVALSSGSVLGGILERICARSGVEKKIGRRFHSLRRSFGTWLAADEVQIETISQMLGHVELDSSVPYLSYHDAEISSCAMGFDDIPLKGGVYGELR